MARVLFDLYLRKDKTPAELLELASYNHDHPPLNGDGPGVLLAVVPMSIQDCEAEVGVCTMCGGWVGFKHYVDSTTDKLVCTQCVETKEAKEAKELKFCDWRQLTCDVCGSYANDEEENIFGCSIANCPCDFNRCLTCTALIEAIVLEEILPLELCELVLQCVTDTRSNKLTWSKMKIRTKSPCDDAQLVLRSKFLSQEEMRLGIISDELRTEDYSGYCQEIAEEADNWLREISTTTGVYLIDGWYIDWSSGFKIKLYYRDEFPPSLMLTTTASHIHEYAGVLRRHLASRCDEGKYFGTVDFTHHCARKEDEEDWDEYNEKIESFIPQFKIVFNELKNKHRDLLPDFLSVEVIDRLDTVEGERCMLICLKDVDVSTTTPTE